jgi:5'-deoxynucleotidase YfbR-like HD superfamily hydrolase
MESKKHKALSQIFVCKYCDKEFTFKQSMYRHIKYTCKKNKDEDLKELVRLLNQEREEKKDLEKKIEKLAVKLEINGLNGSFNTTNIQNNITLLPYRQTDVSHLTDDDYMKCIKKVNHCVKTLIEKVHFNPEKPENMNIYISNMKDKYLMIYDGANWNLANKKDEIDRLYEDKEMMLEEWLDTNPDADLKEKFLRYLKNKDLEDCLLKFKDDIKLVLYNSRPREQLALDAST